MHSGILKYKEVICEITFKSKPSMQTIMFSQVNGHWLPLELNFKTEKQRNTFIKNEPTHVILERIIENGSVIESWNILSIKQFTYKGKKICVLHFNACSLNN